MSKFQKKWKKSSLWTIQKVHQILKFLTYQNSERTFRISILSTSAWNLTFNWWQRIGVPHSNKQFCEIAIYNYSRNDPKNLGFCLLQIFPRKIRAATKVFTEDVIVHWYLLSLFHQKQQLSKNYKASFWNFAKLTKSCKNLYLLKICVVPQSKSTPLKNYVTV